MNKHKLTYYFISYYTKKELFYVQSTKEENFGSCKSEINWISFSSHHSAATGCEIYVKSNLLQPYALNLLLLLSVNNLYQLYLHIFAPTFYASLFASPSILSWNLNWAWWKPKNFFWSLNAEGISEHNSWETFCVCETPLQ